MDLLLNTKSKNWINAYTNNPSNAVIVSDSGDTEMGINLVNYIHDKLIHDKSNPIVYIEDEKSIGIDQIRDIKRIMSLKANNDSGISRIVAIKNAESMTSEAQNALLKLVEELPKSSIICLLVSDIRIIKPTILSRCFLIPILPIDKQTAREYAKVHGFTLDESDKALLLSEGLPSLFISLLTSKDSEFSESVELAKSYLTKSIYERQQQISTVVSKSFNITMFLKALKLIAKSGMRNAKELKAKNRWKNNLIAIQDAEDKLASNSNKKLTMLALSMNIT